MPVFDMIEAFFIMKMNFKPSKFLRFLIRNGYVGKHFSFPFFFLIVLSSLSLLEFPLAVSFNTWGGSFQISLMKNLISLGEAQLQPHGNTL